GLRDGQQIPALAVDRHDSSKLFAAVLGHPYGPNEERGIFRSTVNFSMFADLLDAPRHPKSVLCTESVESLQNHKIEGALQDLGFVSGHALRVSCLHWRQAKARFQE
ncbi:MAG: hypothetical protein WA869_24105, partial [Alloacidobacterium sp.]